MSENNNTTTNDVEQYKREMKKCDKNVEICVGSTAGLAAAGLLLSFVFPIAGIALIGTAIVPEGIMAHQVYKRNKNKKKVEAEKKKEADTKANSVSKDISKEKEKEKNQNINLNFSSGQNANISQNNQNNSQGLNDIANIGNASGNNVSSGVNKTGQQLQNCIQIHN